MTLGPVRRLWSALTRRGPRSENASVKSSAASLIDRLDPAGARKRERKRDADRIRRAQGTASFGGERFIGPDYVSSYVAAARALLNTAQEQDRLDELAIPCLYLQRHAAELLLKSLRSVVDAIAAAEHTLGRSAAPQERKREQKHEHRLPELANETAILLGQVGLRLPDHIDELARDMGAFEKQDPTRLRYPTGARGGYNDMPSFPQKVAVDVLDWQSRLEAILRDRDAMAVDEARQSVWEELRDIFNAVTNELHSRGLL